MEFTTPPKTKPGDLPAESLLMPAASASPSPRLLVAGAAPPAEASPTAPGDPWWALRAA